MTVKTDVARGTRDMDPNRWLKAVYGRRVKFGFNTCILVWMLALLIKYNFVIICQGVSGRVPPNSPLLFEVEVLRVCSTLYTVLLSPLYYNLSVGF